MTTKPRIGLTARAPGALAPYRLGIELSGGEPVVLDPWTPKPELRRLYESLDGVLLPGGAGIASIWRQHRRRNGGGAPRDGWSEMDSADVHLARWALADDLPVLGICRGVQMMALAVDGRLDRSIRGHQLHDLYPAHEIEVAPGSRLRDLLGAGRMGVNSRHARAVASLPPGSGLIVTARSSEDGVVEGIEAEGHTFAVGVQFHPESLVDVDEASRQLFLRFVAACRRNGSG